MAENTLALIQYCGVALAKLENFLLEIEQDPRIQSLSQNSSENQYLNFYSELMGLLEQLDEKLSALANLANFVDHLERCNQAETGQVAIAPAPSTAASPTNRTASAERTARIQALRNHIDRLKQQAEDSNHRPVSNPRHLP